MFMPLFRHYPVMLTYFPMYICSFLVVFEYTQFIVNIIITIIIIIIIIITSTTTIIILL